MKTKILFAVIFFIQLPLLLYAQDPTISGSMYYKYDTIYSGLTEYIDGPSSSGLEIASWSRHKGDAHTVWEELNFPKFVYKSPIGFIGNDTITVINSKYVYQSEKITDTIVYILNCQEFQFTSDTVTVKLITARCKDEHFANEYKSEKVGDSLLISGIVIANCCADKKVLVSYQQDAVNVWYYLSYGGCTCDCDYVYDVKLPLNGNETYINFNDNLKPLHSVFDLQEETITILPNPAADFFTVHTDAVYDNVLIVSRTGQILKQYDLSEKYDLSDIAAGTHILCVCQGNSIIQTEPLSVIKK